MATNSTGEYLKLHADIETEGATLQPIKDRPILRPAYSPTTEFELDEWQVENLDDLVDYYKKLNPPGNISELFSEFCQRQYECQAQIDDEPYSEADYLVDQADSLNDAAATSEEIEDEAR